MDLINRFQGISNTSDPASLLNGLILSEMIKSRHVTKQRVSLKDGFGKRKAGYIYKSKTDTEFCKFNANCIYDRHHLNELSSMYPAAFKGEASIYGKEVIKNLNYLIINGLNKKVEDYKEEDLIGLKSPIRELTKNEYDLLNPSPSIQKFLLEGKNAIIEAGLEYNLKNNKVLSWNDLRKIKDKRLRTMARSFSKISKNLFEMTQFRNQDIENELALMCDLEKNVSKMERIKAYREKYPLEFQQALIDMKDPKENNLLRLYLCSRMDGNDVLTGDQECQFTVDLNDKVVVRDTKISRRHTSYTSNLNYEIQKGSPPIIKFPIVMEREPSTSREDFDLFVEKRKKEINDYFNCQSGVIKKATIDGREVSCPKYNPVKASLILVSRKFPLKKRIKKILYF